ncbi:MAG: hypothetical protein RL268_15 [Pseudomonadota bacterium]|jgi:hypothetical protein
MERVAVYIDGGMFFEGLHAQGFSTDLRYSDLFADLANCAPVELTDICFFMAAYPEGPYPQKCELQQDFFKRLEDEGIQVVPGVTEIRGGMFIERHVEAALATALVEGALTDRFDRALLISRRAAFAPSVSAAIRAGKTVQAAFFRYTFDPADGLAEVATLTTDVTKKKIVQYTRSGPIPHH